MENLVIRDITKLPFLPKSGTVALFIPREIPATYFQEKVRMLKDLLKDEGETLLFLPELMDALTEDVVRYNIPNHSGSIPNWEYIQLRFEEALGLFVDSPVCVLFEGTVAYAADIDDIASLLGQKDILGQRKKPKSKKRRETKPGIFRKILNKVEEGFEATLGNLYDDDYCESRILPEERPRESSSTDLDPSVFTTPQEPKLPKPKAAPKKAKAQKKKEASPEDEEIKRNEKEGQDVYILNRRLLKRLNIDIEQLEALLDEEKRLSKLHITRNGKIILEDYGLTIKIDDLATALYLLFIKHVEGINLKDLQDHYLELLDYYQSVSGRDDRLAMEKTISALVVPGNNSLNVLISRIKSEFMKNVDKDIAENYFIQGKRGKDKFIALDRSSLSGTQSAASPSRRNHQHLRVWGRYNMPSHTLPACGTLTLYPQSSPRS